MGVDKGTGVPASKPSPRPVRDTRTVSDVRAETRQRERGKRDYPEPISPQEALATVRANRASRPDSAISAPEHRAIIREQVRTGVLPIKQADQETRRRSSPAPRYGVGGSLVNDPSKPLSLASKAFGYGLEGALTAIGYATPITPDTIEYAKRAKDQLLAGGSLKEQAEAAAGIGMSAGAISGFGRGKPQPKAVESPRPDEGAEKIIQALPEAKRLRSDQEKLYTAERAKRAAVAERAMQEGGAEGFPEALAALKGELPKLKFGALEHMDQQATQDLLTHIARHDTLRPFEKVSTRTALLKVVDGQTPTRSEIRLLGKAFGSDVGSQIVDSVTFWQAAKREGLSVINIPRALLASGDLSAPFRQALVLGARHPRMFATEFKPMLKAFKSETAYEDVMAEIGQRPTFNTMQKAKLALTDLEGLSTREDAFMSNYAEILTGGKRSPVRMSGRAYVAFLNKFRADAFDNYLRLADEQGLDLTDEHLLRSIAKFVNNSTGRGSIKGLEAAMPAMTAVFFSPRLIASRLQLFNPAYYAGLHPFARKQAVQASARLLGGISLTLGIAAAAGAEVTTDLRSSDFGKIKVGNTRVDITGGHQSYVVNAYRIVKGETVSSTTGEEKKLEGGFGKQSRADIFFGFAQNKLAPVAGYGTHWLQGENFGGDEFDPLKEAGRSLLPLGGQNAYDGFKESPAAGAASLGLGTFGFGVQTYKAKPSRSVTKEYKAQLKDIALLEKRGELSPTAARELRDIVEQEYEQAKHDASLGERRSTVEDGIRADIPLKELNSILKDDGHKPLSASEYEKIEKDVLKLDVQVGK